MTRLYFKLTLVGILAVIGGVYLWNAWQYSVWSSYDGGAHIEYIYTLADTGRLPNKAENYLAWHEPLYYGLNAVVVKALRPLQLSRSAIYKLLQLENALFALAIVSGAALLSWLITRRQWITLVVTASSGLLFVVGAVGRYITNEALAHALIVWWLIWFFYWQMTNAENWSWQRWFWLAFGLGVVVLTKLTGFILVFAVLIWLVVWSALDGPAGSHSRAVGLACLVLVVVGSLYAPWFYHKKKMYGQGLTVNSFETDGGRQPETRALPSRFFASWDSEILSYPFWTAASSSFWSILYGSALGDYDNIFQNYEANKTVSHFLTSNGRTMSVVSATHTLALLWWSVPFLLWAIVGCLLYLWEVARRRVGNDWLLPLVVGGLLVGLMYNVYQYPYLERGTLKAIFVVSLFPLTLLIAAVGWDRSRVWSSWPRSAIWLGWSYLAVWCFLSALVIFLPA